MDDEELKELFDKEEDADKSGKSGPAGRSPSAADEKAEPAKAAPEEEGVTVFGDEAKKTEGDGKKAEGKKVETETKKAETKKAEGADADKKAETDKKPDGKKTEGKVQARPGTHFPFDISDREPEPFPISLRTMLLMILGVLLLIFVLSVAFHPFFRVKEINISGNVAVSDQEILEAAGIEYNDHLFSGISGGFFDVVSMDYGDTERRIEANNPYIKNIEISVKFPSTINIEVTERQKVAYVKVPDGYAAIDSEGIVLELDSHSDDTIRPLICGLDIDSVVIGKKLKAIDDTAYQKMIIVLGAVLAADSNSGVNSGYSFFENLIEVRMLPSGNFFLTIYLPEGSILQVKLKEIDNINEDMSQLCFAILEGAFDNLPDGVLDMTDEEFIYREYE